MKALIGFFLCFLLNVSAMAQVETPSLDYYLPDDVTYDESIPTPKEVLGMEVGEWHVRHDQLVKYMYAVAEASDRISITEYARTYENRPLLLLTVTSEDNHANIDEIKQKHVQLTDANTSEELDISSMPAVVWMGYSVHGNEPSGSNSSLAVAYYLAAAQGPEIEETLNNTVILMDPSINPDGLNRFAHWANTNRSINVLVSDPESREYDEEWPGGRTNHYWFDLNRDWLLVQHPESKGRIQKFHEWKPNVLTDHHEMGSNSTFFFQPGIPSRTHPITPQLNQDLTGAIAEYHADALDKIQSLYYSEESFDDFYYGKGSTYPDVNGSIGILFEQASSRGHVQETDNGLLTFPFTIRNQFMTSLSTIKAANSLREEMLSSMRVFYRDAAEEADDASVKAYVFGENDDQARTNALAELLTRHQINVHKLNEDHEGFEAGKAYVVPTNQQQYKLITAVFERRTTFTDSLFYDVSAWTLPMAFNLPFEELGNRDFNEDLLGDAYTLGTPLEGELIGGESNYAYVFEWDEYYAPRAAYRLLSAGARVRVASLPFTAVTDEGAMEFDYGTVMVPLGIQDDPEAVHDIMRTITEEDGIKVYDLSTGLTTQGIDLGSNNFENMRDPKVAIIGGPGSSSYEVGEVWHLLDQRYHMPLTMLTTDNVAGTDLSRYNTLVMTGSFGNLSERAAENIKNWVSSGGTLITYKYGITWAKRNGLANFEYASGNSNGEEEEEVQYRPYVKAGSDRGAQVIGGAIFNATLDLTHPISYGFDSEEMTVFRNSTLFVEAGNNPYSTPVLYTDEPLASGYISEENEERLAGTAAVLVSGYGRGNVIVMPDNPNFRAFWYGTNKLFANAMFFGHTISGGTRN